MRLTYDPEADASYLKVSDGRNAQTTEVAPGVMVDLTDEGDLVGVEILAASRRPGAEPLKLAFEILENDESDRTAAE
jgi:uncharacterized protein YuzE